MQATILYDLGKRNNLYFHQYVSRALLTFHFANQNLKMSKVMMMPVPRFVATSVVSQEPDDAILSFIKDELDYDLLAEYFLEEDGAFDNVGR